MTIRRMHAGLLGVVLGCAPRVSTDTQESSSGGATGVREVGFCRDGEERLDPADDTAVPEVSILAPAPDEVLPLEGRYLIIGSVVDDNCVALLEIWRDGELSLTISKGAMQQEILNALTQPRTRRIRIEAEDASGQRGESDEVEVFIQD
jgi:hypothetical protein